uniref:RING-type domain-containing protein n=1 Tax=Monopterus albus TaxID=43700 RepID=A0A3Q3R790_MONAL
VRVQAQRKRRTTGSPLVSRCSTKTSRRANVRRMASRMANGSGSSDGVEEVVDLTCEGSEAPVVDLTSNDSILVRNTLTLLLHCGPQSTRVPQGESYVVSSDEDEDLAPVFNFDMVSSVHTSRLTPGTISCPVCLDSYSEIIESRRLVVSTKCGHVFCSQCLRDALTSSHTCPTCRKRLTHRQYHPLYI